MGTIAAAQLIGVAKRAVFALPETDLLPFRYSPDLICSSALAVGGDPVLSVEFPHGSKGKIQAYVNFPRVHFVG